MQSKQPYVFYLDRLELEQLNIEGRITIEKIEWGAPNYPDFGMYIGEPLYKCELLSGDCDYDGTDIVDAGDFWEVHHYRLGKLPVVLFSWGGHTRKLGSADLPYVELMRQVA